IAEQHAFGQLEFKPNRIEIRFLQDALDHVDEVHAADCSDETLTAMVNSGHALPSTQARRSTQLPRSMINPLCSAIAMNSVGGISPRVGCFQRQSASTPTTVSPLLLTTG